MNKSLFNFFVVGVALIDIQTASTMMDLKASDKPTHLLKNRSNTTKYELRNFDHNKENQTPKKNVSSKKDKKSEIPQQPLKKRQSRLGNAPKKLTSKISVEEIQEPNKILDFGTALDNIQNFSWDADCKEWFDTMPSPEKPRRWNFNSKQLGAYHQTANLLEGKNNDLFNELKETKISSTSVFPSKQAYSPEKTRIQSFVTLNKEASGATKNITNVDFCIDPSGPTAIENENTIIPFLSFGEKDEVSFFIDWY